LQPFLKQSKDFPFNFMDLGLNGMLALVTGSTTGIGAAIAEGLARERARVIVNGRTEYRVQKAIEAIKTRVEDAAVEGFASDLSRPSRRGAGSVCSPRGGGEYGRLCWQRGRVGHKRLRSSSRCRNGSVHYLAMPRLRWQKI